MKVFKLLRIKIGEVERKTLNHKSKSLMNEAGSPEGIRRLKMGFVQ